MWNLKYGTNESMRQKQPHTQRGQTWVANAEGSGRGKDWECGVSGCK